MSSPTLFTIGHSNHELSALLELLARHAVTAVADVRSQPTSWLTHFDRAPLTEALRRAGIEYVFLGDELGARRAEPECYDGDRADYDAIARLPLFQRGLTRVRQGLEKHRICLLCAEKEPLDCHRTILVCRQRHRGHREDSKQRAGKGAANACNRAISRRLFLSCLLCASAPLWFKPKPNTRDVTILQPSVLTYPPA
jgi:uncharacterized protein (DUF488 family)